MGEPLEVPEEEARNRVIDAARSVVMSSTGQQPEDPGALDRLSCQAYGDADRLRGDAEQLRRRFDGADAIPLLEAAARHAEASTEPEPPVHSAHSHLSDTPLPEPNSTLIVRSPSDPGDPSPADPAHP